MQGASCRVLRPQDRGGTGVADADHAVAVEREHSLVDPVEHRGLVLHERGEPPRGEAEGQPQQAAADEDGGDRGEREARERRGQHAEQGGRQVGEDTGAREADADLADDVAASGTVDRHLRARRLPERPRAPRHRLATGERLLGAGGHDLAEPLGVGVRQPDPLVVGDHDEEGAGALLDRLGGRLEHAVLQLVARGRAGIGGVGGDGVAHVGVLGDGARDGERRLLRLAPQLLDAEGRDESGADEHRGRDGRELQHEHVGREAHRASSPQVTAQNAQNPHYAQIAR